MVLVSCFLCLSTFVAVWLRLFSGEFMPNYFYTDTNGVRQGPVDRDALEKLAVNGSVTPTTLLETDTGFKGQARRIPYLGFKYLGFIPGSQQVYWEWGFVFSCMALAALVPHGHAKIPALLIALIVAFLVATLVTFRFSLLERVFESVIRWQMLLASVFALVAAFNFYNNFCWVFHKGIEIGSLPRDFEPLSMLVHVVAGPTAIAALPATFVFLYAFISRFMPVVTEGISKSDFVEKAYFIIGGVILSVTLVILYNTTTAFYGGGHKIDVIYSADSYVLLAHDCWMNINAGQNDFRQVLFAVFAMPFAIAATLVSYPLFFLPNAYLVCMGIIQIGLVLVSTLLIGRMLRLDACSKAFFLMAFSLSYPFLVYSFLVEQYVFVVFWLILFIHSAVFHRPHRDFLFVAATGSLLTSGFFFLLLSSAKNWKKYLLNIVSGGLKFLAVVVLFGQFSVFLAIQRIITLAVFSEANRTFDERFLMFVNFIQGCFIQPQTEIRMLEYLSSKSYGGFPSPDGIFAHYTLAMPVSLNFVGLFFLLWATAGFILNAKNMFAQVCFAWIIASFLILCVGGWGTTWNEMGLFVYYFGWAYFCLAFLAIEKTLQKLPKIKYVVYSALIVVLAFINIPGFYDLIQFGFKYYPCP